MGQSELYLNVQKLLTDCSAKDVGLTAQEDHHVRRDLVQAEVQELEELVRSTNQAHTTEK